MQSFVDLHSHHIGQNQVDVWKNINLQLSSSAFAPLEVISGGAGKTTYSVGLHPWYIDCSNHHTQLEQITSLLPLKDCLALGEAGLDKLIPVDYALQTNLFVQQIELSEYYQKPMILHCVRSFQEILQLKKLYAPTQAWIFHGFNQKAAILEQVLRSGCYLSIGAAVMNSKSSISKLLPYIEIESIFLETDNSRVSIQEIYSQIMLLKEMEQGALILAIQKNMYKIFGKSE